ncbi:ABC transporter ATP-binding protein [Methylopila sp. M107]|uniref:ABC transporter ATP-binding protein n=1 Tax=Methylopila sp. M107 TaxID=1101190 RepID=UPI00037FBEA1|nr:ABC transporter ATP-binding protein [Methylopila sp. M107]
MTLEAEALATGYRGRRVGSGIALAVRPGETLCLLGPNGSGKTTLFKTLFGLLPPQAGRVTFLGEDMARWSRKKLAQTVAYVPQAHAAFFPFLVRDVVLMGRAARVGLFQQPAAQDRVAAEEAMNSLGVLAFAERPYSELSGGERQLVLIARALAQEPKVLVMDEPTASLDLGNETRVLERVRSLARQGLGVVLSTHDPDHAFVAADRVALMADGGILALGTPDETITPDNLMRLYGVAVSVVYVAELGRRIVAPSLRAEGRTP